MNKEKIDNAILTLEVLIDCCKEDGTYYNAIKEWEALEVFKNLAKRIDKAIEYMQNFDIFDKFSFPLMKKWEEQEVKSSIEYEFNNSLYKDLLEILKGEDNE